MEKDKPAQWILEQIKTANESIKQRPEWMKHVNYLGCALPSKVKVKG